jgi:hypothetical protein
MSKAKATKKKTPEKDILRTVLVMLKNRFTPLEAPRFVEIVCQQDGTILQEKVLRSEPKEARFAEVWFNDEVKKSIADCTRFKRIYRHKLEAPLE